MSLQCIDLTSALRRLADQRIEDAMKEGKFDNLPGAGQPLGLEPMPAQEEARLMWWAIRLLKQNDFTPHEIAWRKQVDRLKSELHEAKSEADVRRLVSQINALVAKINTVGTNAMQNGVAPVSLESQLDALRQRLGLR